MENQVAASTIVGEREEPFLAAALESVKDSVDLIVINDNSSGRGLANLKVIENSTLFCQNKVKILTTEFSGFSAARNLCLEYLGKSAVKPGWLLKLDTDEVHSEGLLLITRELLPLLPPQIGGVDGYWLLFIQSFEHFARLERRHNLILRFTPDLHWEGKVHEKLLGKTGKTLALPYLFFHYGYVGKLENTLLKWQLYQELGDDNYAFLAKTEPEALFEKETEKLFPLKAPHPLYAQDTIARIKAEQETAYQRFQSLIKNRKKSLKQSLAGFFRYLNYRQLWYFKQKSADWQFIGQPEITAVLKKLGELNRQYRI